MKKVAITRRDFIRGTACAALAASLGVRAEAQDPAAAKTRVVLMRDAEALNAQMQPNAEVIQRMLDDAVCALFGVKDPVAAWKQIIKPADIVGIKTNVWEKLSTPKEVEQALKKRVIVAGVSEEKIAIDDRGVLKNPIFQNATALINTRPFRSHHWAGVGGCIKNYIMFSDNPPSWHDDSCANLAGVWDLPACRDKTRLNILVMLTPLFHGKGPHHFNASYTWDYKGLILSADPVAADATGLRILQAKRKAHFGKEEPLYVPPKHIQVAETKYRLGLADPGRIDLVKVGWAQDLLI